MPLLDFFIDLAKSGGEKAFARAGQRVKVSILEPNNHRDISEIVDLYERRIDQSQQYETHQFIEWIQDASIRKTLNNTVFVAKHDRHVVGFLQLMMPNDCKHLFASYFAVDETSVHGRVEAAEGLVFRAMLYATNLLRQPSVIFEVERPHPDKDAVKAQHDFARIRRFKNLFERFGYRAYELAAPYIQPEMPNDAGYANRHDMLLMMATDKQLNAITRVEYDEIVGFIYDRIYGLTFKNDPELRTIYQQELTETRKYIISQCPDPVPLR
ncbi:MAG: hypothetical protein P4L87_07295 [Formivibrio sp.]|nr:hypothetical protein [Formivibrio sp.]